MFTQQNCSTLYLNSSITLTSLCNLDHIVPTFTVNFLNIRTPKNFVVITLKFELCGSTIE